MEALRARGLTQSALAELIGVTRGAVGQWRTGETAPSTENLAQAAKVLRISYEWLATAHGTMELPDAPPDKAKARIVRVPLVSWVSAGKLADAQSQIPVEDVPLLAFADLGRGDFFALRVDGDSMDRVSPDGSIIVVNRGDRELVPERPYVFSRRGEATYKLWRAAPDHLAPHSWNAANRPIFVKGKRDFEVIGRVRRSVLDL